MSLTVRRAGNDIHKECGVRSDVGDRLLDIEFDGILLSGRAGRAEPEACDGEIARQDAIHGFSSGTQSGECSLDLLFWRRAPERREMESENLASDSIGKLS